MWAKDGRCGERWDPRAQGFGLMGILGSIRLQWGTYGILNYLKRGLVIHEYQNELQVQLSYPIS